ncbi:MAG: trypsin-like serine peptidase [Nitrosopumilaceae archaeon]
MTRQDWVLNLLRRSFPNLISYERFLQPLPEILDTLLTSAIVKDWEILTGQKVKKGSALEKTLSKKAKSIADSSKSGVNKVLRGKDKKLTDEEIDALEAIILLKGRPAIFVQKGKLTNIPDEWNILNQHQKAIEDLLPSVGRICVIGHPRHAWLGTGFLVSDDAIMTNKHVAIEFAELGKKGAWKFKCDHNANIDFFHEYDNTQTAEFKITKIIGMHDSLDMALLKVSSKSKSKGAKKPKPLTLSSDEDDATMQERFVYTVGYPAWDGTRNDPDSVRKIYGDVFGVKRLSPGQIIEFNTQTKIMKHDCSTLGGNSGSCIVDVGTNKVIGLHFSGLYRQWNKGIALWKLSKDRLLKKADVHFE